MGWSTDTKTGYDDLEVYMEYGYVFVSSTGRDDVKMAAFSFNWDYGIDIQWLSVNCSISIANAMEILQSWASYRYVITAIVLCGI